MIRINKNLIAFAGLISLLGVSTLIVLQKLIPFAKHTSYYCQSLVNSFSMPISHYVGAIPFVLLFIFSAVAAIKLFIILIKAQFLKRNLIKKSRTDPSFSALLEKLQLTNKTYLVESNKQFAFCLGIRTPKIYISTALTSLLSIQEVEVVLRHERYHLENRDSLTMIIASIGESLLPFFPLLSDFLHNYRIEREIEADKEAVRGLGNSYPLISVLKKLLTTPSLATMTVSAIADEDTLESRIKALVKKDYRFKEFKAKHIIISLFSAFIMSVIMLAPVQAVEVHRQGQDIMMICPHGSLCISECKQEYSAKKVNHSEDLLYSPIK